MKYTATLENFGKKYSAKGDTIIEAISSLNPKTIAGRSVLVVESKDNKAERIIQQVIAKRAFTSHGMMQEVALKNLSLLFTGI